jgi:cupin 2 domain-containing protein
MMRTRNFFDIEDYKSEKEEVFDELIRTPYILLERIISAGQASPEGEWYDQEQDEWVMLLQGEAILEIEGKPDLAFHQGDYLCIPAHIRHRVKYTSCKPECLWLALHGELK